MYALWYPQLARDETRQLPEKLKQLPAKSWLHVALSVRGSDAAEGMRGSGIFVLNPPWYLQKNLQQVMPYLVKYLAQNDQAEFILEYHENPVK